MKIQSVNNSDSGMVKVNISSPKMLGGIGMILSLLGAVPWIGILFIIIGYTMLTISIYQLSKILKNPKIFNMFIVALSLGFIGGIIAVVFGLISFISTYAFSGFRGEGATVGLGFGFVIAIIIAYAIFIVAAYFYKQSYSLLAQAINHKMFNTAGLTMFIGAITMILLIGFIISFIGNILLIIAFFTAPDEVEVPA